MGSGRGKSRRAQSSANEGAVECLEAGPDCEGEVEYRMNPSGGRAWPRCEKHAEAWYERQAETMRRYPVMAPSDFDPDFAGESWDED